MQITLCAWIKNPAGLIFYRHLISGIFYCNFSRLTLIIDLNLNKIMTKLSLRVDGVADRH